MKLKQQSPDDTLAKLRQLYETIYDQTESFEEQHIGSDLAYLMGAIIINRRCLFDRGRPLVKLIREQPDIQWALEYIREEEVFA